MTRGVALVTGGSSGIGRATALALAARGWRVYELSRRENPPEGVEHLTADVTDTESVERAVAELLLREGRIDLLVNNAGMGVSGAVEFTADAEAHRQMEVNFFGTFRLCRAVIPAMRAAGGGRILNIGSVGGPLALPFQAFYSASKQAVSALSLALQNELRPFHISVSTILPGDIASGFTDARRKASEGDEVYGGRIARSVGTMERDERGGMTCEAAGRFIARVAEKKNPAPRYVIGAKYRLFLALYAVLPLRFVNFVLGKIYAK